MDRLADILSRFSVNAHVFFSGNLCGVQDFDENEGKGHLHLLRSGELTVVGDDKTKIVLDTPSVLFFPGPTRHRLFADEQKGVDIVCANIGYQNASNSLLTQSLPTFLHYELNETEMLSSVATWLFDEAFSERCGRQPVIDRLCDIFIVNVLRRVIADGGIQVGMMAGLAHPQLSRVLVRIHETPEENWSLEDMASFAGMSRSKFAAEFKSVIGQTPGDYITQWRIAVAQNLIRKKANMDYVANSVGYENGSVLARVFRKKLGLSPKEWLNKSQPPE